MDKAKFLKTVFAVGVVAACGCGLAACGGSGAASGGTAATVTYNGETNTIPEEEITTTIQNLRAQSGYEEEDAWGEFLASSDMTPESVRQQMIDSRVDEWLAKQGAAELGITVESSEIDTYVESMKANFDTDEAWDEALTQAGFTAESYRENIESSLLTQAINQHFQDEAKTTKKENVEAANTYVTYYDGAKRSSHILIGVDDTSDKKAMKQAREKAAELKQQIENGEISFADAAKENSTDTGSAEKGGDVGWDVLNSFVTEYTDALDKLEEGQISDPVDSQYGVHLITVTDVFNAPKKVKKLTDLPEEFRDTVKDYAKSTKANEDYQAWLDGLKEKAEIQVNDMPADVPYNVDMTKYATSDESESSDASAEAEAEGEEADASAESEDAASADASAESEDAASADAANEGEEADAETSDESAADEEASE